MQNYHVFASFVFGVASFFSPCILPLIPAYISYITGVSIDNLKKDTKRHKILLLSLSFVLGFTIVFTLLGASASWLGNFLFLKRNSIRMAGSLLIILFGLHLTGIVKVKFLYFQKKFNPNRIVSGQAGALLLGIIFAFGWTPCVGPVLASILTMASMEATVLRGTVLLFSYSLGIGLPFILTTLLLEKALKVFEKVKKHYALIQITTGILLMFIGILLFFNKLQILIPASSIPKKFG